MLHFNHISAFKSNTLLGTVKNICVHKQNESLLTTSGVEAGGKMKVPGRNVEGKGHETGSVYPTTPTSP